MPGRPSARAPVEPSIVRSCERLASFSRTHANNSELVPIKTNKISSFFDALLASVLPLQKIGAAAATARGRQGSPRKWGSTTWRDAERSLKEVMQSCRELESVKGTK